MRRWLSNTRLIAVAILSKNKPVAYAEIIREKTGASVSVVTKRLCTARTTDTVAARLSPRYWKRPAFPIAHPSSFATIVFSHLPNFLYIRQQPGTYQHQQHRCSEDSRYGNSNLLVRILPEKKWKRYRITKLGEVGVEVVPGTDNANSRNSSGEHIIPMYGCALQ